MSNEEVVNSESPEAKKDGDSVKLNSLYGFKSGMSSVYNEEGVQIPVTVIRLGRAVVSQIKTNEKDGYSAVQIAIEPKKSKNTTAAERGRLKETGLAGGAYFHKEIRQDIPEGAKVGQKVAIESLQKGDKIKVIGKTKGRGFSGVMKRWGHAGGPASHGAGFHRRPGSIGNCTWPGRVMPGRKMPGQFGNVTKTLINVQVVELIPEENTILVKGSVPGAKNGILKLEKVF